MYLDKLREKNTCRSIKQQRVMGNSGVYTLGNIREMSGHQKNGICESVDRLQQGKDLHEIPDDATCEECSPQRGSNCQRMVGGSKISRNL